MNLNYEIRKRIKSSMAPALGLLLVCYFSYHLIEGDRGLFSYIKLQQDLHTETAQLQLTEIEREKLAKRVRLLDPQNLDLDMLEERARDVLGLAHPDELVIYTK